MPSWQGLFIREKDVANLSRSTHRKFQTQREQAFDLVLMAAKTLLSTGKQLWVVADAADTMKPFVRPVMDLGATRPAAAGKDPVEGRRL